MSLADAFAAALTSRVKGEILTGDPEFRSVEDRIRVVWLGPRAPKAREMKRGGTGRIEAQNWEAD